MWSRDGKMLDSVRRNAGWFVVIPEAERGGGPPHISAASPERRRVVSGHGSADEPRLEATHNIRPDDAKW